MVSKLTLLAGKMIVSPGNFQVMANLLISYLVLLLRASGNAAESASCLPGR